MRLSVRDLSISYANQPALSGVSLDVHEREIFGIIGPAGSGKTSFLRTLNRMEMLHENMTVDGSIVFDGHDISEIQNVYALRRRIGVVFPLPVGLPLSIYDNVALAPRLSGIKEKSVLDETVER
ncbi:MAG: ATP-binding cassette domain-containing protein, partial [Gemmatimonadota bacterium]|nr:ATP-binding cassette domain-containing protein [Gemmatimonadota bacterium]